MRISTPSSTARVYADPAQVVQRLTGDPQAIERLAAGDAPAYVQVHGRAAGLFRGPDAARQAADREVPALRGALSTYHHAGREAAQARPYADRLGGTVQLPHLDAQAHPISRALQVRR
jgi:hypothetical protein